MNILYYVLMIAIFVSNFIYLVVLGKGAAAAWCFVAAVAWARLRRAEHQRDLYKESCAHYRKQIAGRC